MADYIEDGNYIYGVAYYAEYMPEERTVRDYEMMKAAGINTIRIGESTWSTWEPRDGEFDFSILIHMLDEAEKAGLNVIIGTPTYAVPAWLVKKDPHVLALTHKGQTIYGARQQMDICNPTYIKHSERIIRKMMEVVKPYACVIGFQLDNETKYYDTCGDDVQRLFVRHLQEKYGTVEALNKAWNLNYWSNAVGSWEDFPAATGTINYSMAGEFDAFRRSLAANFLKWQRKIVDEYRREDQFVTHNFDFEWRGASFGVQDGISHQEAADALTIAGCDIYHPTQDDLTGKEIAFCGDLTRGLKDKEYLVLETEAQGFKEWTPYPGQLRQQALSHVASGAKGVSYWHWASLHNACETYWKGVLSHDLEEDRTYREVSAIGKELKELMPKLAGYHRSSEIAIVTDNRSQAALKYLSLGYDTAYSDVVRWCYDALYEMNVSTDVIDVTTLEKRKAANGGKLPYRMLITPALYCVSEETVGLLKEFVAGGGVLVSTFKSFFSNEDVTVWHDRQPHGLTEVFGIHYDQISGPKGVSVAGMPIRAHMDLVEADGAEVLEAYEHRYWSAYAAVTENSYGEGKAYYVAAMVDSEVLKNVFVKAVIAAGLRDTVPGCEFPTIVRSGVDGGGRAVHFVFNYTSDSAYLMVPYDSCEDLLTGSQYHKGDILMLGDWGVSVLREN